MSIANQIIAEANARADGRMDELLPMVLERMTSRAALVRCERHEVLLGPYVKAQIHLTRAKRRLYQYDELRHHDDPIYFPDGLQSGCPEKSFMLAMVARNAARVKYRSTPCTCWVPKR